MYLKNNIYTTDNERILRSFMGVIEVVKLKGRIKWMKHNGIYKKLSI